MNDEAADDSTLKDALKFYADGREATRLTRSFGPLELARTRELLARFLPPAPAVVMDVGAGTGVYAKWLAERGYEVHAIDAVVLHVEEMKRSGIGNATVGDARSRSRDDASVDAVLLAGPMYHLTERRDRITALGEARRVLRRGGVLLATAIPHLASTIVGIVNGWIGDADYLAMVRREFADGQHRRPASWPALFTNSFFHRPAELKEEIAEAGFVWERTIAIQGAGWLAGDFAARWADARQREGILEAVRLMEEDEAVMGLSPHVMAVARRE